MLWYDVQFTAFIAILPSPHYGIDVCSSSPIMHHFMIFAKVNVDSALTLLVGWQEGHPACKN